MGKSEYTLEEVNHIIDLVWGFAYEDWQVPGHGLHEYILHLQEIGKNNGDMKKEGDANLGYHRFHNPDSQSPTELNLPKMTEQQRNSIVTQVDDYDLFEDLPEFDTLQEGDWMVGSWEQYQEVLKIAKHDFPGTFENGMVFYRKEYEGDSGLKSRIPGIFEYGGKTQLTPEEFLRRAENTFKTK